MHKIYALLRQWLFELAETAPSPDPLSRFSSQELADLPTHHAAADARVGT